MDTKQISEQSSVCFLLSIILGAWCAVHGLLFTERNNLESAEKFLMPGYFFLAASILFAIILFIMKRKKDRKE